MFTVAVAFDGSGKRSTRRPLPVSRYSWIPSTEVTCCSPAGAGGAGAAAAVPDRRKSIAGRIARAGSDRGRFNSLREDRVFIGPYLRQGVLDAGTWDPG